MLISTQMCLKSILVENSFETLREGDCHCYKIELLFFFNFIDIFPNRKTLSVSYTNSNLSGIFLHIKCARLQHFKNRIILPQEEVRYCAWKLSAYCCLVKAGQSSIKCFFLNVLRQRKSGASSFLKQGVKWKGTNI